MTTEILEKVVQKELHLLQEHLLTQGKTINFSKNIAKYLVEKMDNKPEYGAREVKSQVENIVVDALAQHILDLPENSRFKVKVEDQKIVIES